jgi:hypothetical protein
MEAQLMPRGALRSNGIFAGFFEAEASRLAEARHEMSRRFLAGGRLKDGFSVCWNETV